MCCTWLAGNTGPKKSPKILHLVTIAQLCWTISSQLRHISTTGENLVKQQCLPHMSSEYDELRPTSGWDLLASFWCTPAHFNGFRVLAALLHGTVVVGVSQTAALNRWRHLYSAGRPLCLALAHILVVNNIARSIATTFRLYFTDCRFTAFCATREAACGRVRRKFLDVQIQSSDVVQTGVFDRSSPTETQTPGSSTGCRQHRNRSVCFKSRRHRSTIFVICSVCERTHR